MSRTQYLGGRPADLTPPPYSNEPLPGFVPWHERRREWVVCDADEDHDPFAGAFGDPCWKCGGDGGWWRFGLAV